MSDIKNAPPVKMWVFVDEHPDSINDGWLTGRWPGGGGGDLAASYHAGACGIGFADGHGEVHKWKDKGALPPVKKQNDRVWNTDDTLWFMERTTAPIP